MKAPGLTRRSFLGSALAVGTAGWSRASPLPPSPAPDHLARLAFLTDLHTRVEWDTPQALSRCADLINAQKPDLVICGGDLITDGFTLTPGQVADRWQALRTSLWDRLQAPIYTAIGNHDLVGVEPADGSAPAPDIRADFLAFTGYDRTYYSVAAAGCHLVFLDPFVVTGDEARYQGAISDEQLAWLRADLAGVDPQIPLVLVVHMPLLTGYFQATRGAAEPAPRNRVVTNNREVLEACAGHNLRLVLQGHLHVNELLRWRDTTLVTGGAVCGQWWRGPWQGTAEGFGLATLYADRVDWTYHALGWQARRPRDA